MIRRNIHHRRFCYSKLVLLWWITLQYDCCFHYTVQPVTAEKLTSTTGSNEDDIETMTEIPIDGHFTADMLPPELSDSSSCYCEPSHGCIDDEKNKAPNKDASSSTSSSCGARIFYLVSIHNNRTLNDALLLFRAIRDVRNIIVFHIDTKFNVTYYNHSTLRQEIEACPCGSRVEVDSVHDAAWSSWSMNLPTFWGMKKAVIEYADKWDVFINLSGDTLPVYTPNRIASLFGGPLSGINFITSSACETGLVPTPISFFPKHWHKYRHYASKPANLTYTDQDGDEHTNVTMEIHFGSQWMALQPSWCQYLVTELERPDSLPCRFRDYLIETGKLMTDETFIPTLLMYLFPQTVPIIDEDYTLDNDDVDMYAIRYERMDEHYPTSTGIFPTVQRYDVPNSTGVEKPRPWGPYFLGVYDLYDIYLSGALYIRKVSQRIDHNMYRILPVDDPDDIPPISWPHEVKIIDKPDWKKKLEELKKKQATEKAAKDGTEIEEKESSEEEESNEEDEEEEKDEESKEEGLKKEESTNGKPQQGLITNDSGDEGTPVEKNSEVKSQL